MNFNICVVLAYNFVVLITSVTGKRDEPKNHGNTPPRPSHQSKQEVVGSDDKPSSFSSNIGPPSRRPSYVGQPPRQSTPDFEYARQYYQHRDVNYNNWRNNPFSDVEYISKDFNMRLIMNRHIDQSRNNFRQVSDDLKRQYTNNAPSQLQNRKPNTSVGIVGKPSRSAMGSNGQQSRSVGSDGQHTRSASNYGQPVRPSQSFNEYAHGYYQNTDVNYNNWRNNSFFLPKDFNVRLNMNRGIDQLTNSGPDDLKPQYTNMEFHSQKSKQDTNVGTVGQPSRSAIDSDGLHTRAANSDSQFSRHPQSSYEYERVTQKLDVNYNNWPQNPSSGVETSNNFFSGPDDPVKLQLTNKPFTFVYTWQDVGCPLIMDIYFKFPSDVRIGFVSLRTRKTDDRPEKEFFIGNNSPYESEHKVAHIKWKFPYNEVFIDVQLYKETEMCLKKRIAEGRMLDENIKNSDGHYKHSLFCKKCSLEVDLRNSCGGADIIEAVNFKLFIIIGASLIAIALLVFVIVAIVKRCWIKCDAPDPLDTLQTTNELPCKPFYLNLLFRKECQEIIDDLEQNHYELID